MKAYLINLDSAEERLTQFDKQANSLGFAYQRVPAVDGRTPAYAESLGERTAGPIRGRVIAPVEVACFESHLAAWRAIADSGDSHGVILEDDVILKSGFESYVAPDWIPSDADIVRLEGVWRPLHIEKTPACVAYGRAVHRLRSGSICTGAYAISSKCANYLLEHITLLDDPVDEVLLCSWSPVYKALIIYQMTPAPARQAKFFADYQGQEFAKSTIAAARGQTEQFDHLTTRAPWWRIFPDMPSTTFKDTRNMAYWIAKERAKSVLKGTRFTFIPFG